MLVSLIFLNLCDCQLTTTKLTLTENKVQKKLYNFREVTQQKIYKLSKKTYFRKGGKGSWKVRSATLIE